MPEPKLLIAIVARRICGCAVGILDDLGRLSADDPQVLGWLQDGCTLRGEWVDVDAPLVLGCRCGQWGRHYRAVPGQPGVTEGTRSDPPSIESMVGILKEEP